MPRFPMRPPVVVVAPPPAPPPIEEIIEIPEEEVAESPAFTVRHLYWKATIWLLIGLGIQTLAALSPSLVELLYSQTAYFHIARILTYLNRVLPFPLGEILFWLLVIWFFGWTLWYLRRAFRREARFFDVVKILVLHLIWTFSILFVLFLLLWGLNFERMPIAETMGLARRPARSDELLAIGARIVDGINKNYEAASSGQGWEGGQSRLPMAEPKLLQALEDSFRAMPLLGEARQGGLGAPKPLYTSRIASGFGAEGIFIPYSGEPLYNSSAPSCDLPFIVARQMAHQRGYAREDEASLVAYIVCTNSREPYIQYSGFLHGIGVLEEIEKAGIGQFKIRVGRGPSSDLDARIYYWSQARSDYTETFFQRLTSLYLRLNRVRSGYDNFNEDIPLIIGYYLRAPSFRPEEAPPENPKRETPPAAAPQGGGAQPPRPAGGGVG